MTPARFAKLALLDRVEVQQFGSHPGVVAEIGPTVEIQGRRVTPAGWVRVRLDDGRDFAGHFKLLAFRASRPLATA